MYNSTLWPVPTTRWQQQGCGNSGIQTGIYTPATQAVATQIYRQTSTHQPHRLQLLKYTDRHPHTSHIGCSYSNMQTGIYTSAKQAAATQIYRQASTHQPHRLQLLKYTDRHQLTIYTSSDYSGTYTDRCPHAATQAAATWPA